MRLRLAVALECLARKKNLAVLTGLPIVEGRCPSISLV